MARVAPWASTRVATAASKNERAKSRFRIFPLSEQGQPTGYQAEHCGRLVNRVSGSLSGDWCAILLEAALAFSNFTFALVEATAPPAEVHGRDEA